ncbi:MAG: Hpt domain-containing protein [Algoriphagus sp.]|uniref:Hpt domain-containing protein n=1 Tax=Algoriphagus sp. TaxID=1872435 RepID=UPI0026318FE9|nr:Hpt domain-containing protein [Algoriphagus sp.]MDG1277984.1 Hpt domain-containing protein [Algoriphagus sp.]
MYQLISEQSIYQYFGDDDPDLIKSMIQIILTSNIHDLKELPQFYESNDFVTIKKRIHKAKPSMSYIGAQSTRKLIERIEENVEDSLALNEQLQSNLSKIEEELHDFLKSV